MEGWRKYTLGDLLEIKHGFAFKGEFFSDQGPYVLLSPGNFREEGGLKLKGDKEKFYSGDFPKEFLLKRGDLLVAMTDLTQNAPILGSPAFIPEDNRFLHNQRLGKVIKLSQSEITYDFLFYLLNTTLVRGQIKGSATGATVRHTSPSRIYDVAVQIPPLPIQRRIAGILSAYDDLIENSQRRIKILESIARALYREWFVHFRFPGHESVPLVSSALGAIPQGWKARKLSDLITYNRRVTKPGPHLQDRQYVPIDCLPSKSLALLEAKPIEDAQSSLQLFEKGDILFGAMRPYFHKVVVAPFSGVTRTTCFVFKPVRPEWHAFSTMTAFDEATVAHANAHSQGATIPYAVWDGSLSEMPIVLPSSAVLQRFESVVAPILAQLTQSFFALSNLRRTRDLLLPRLLSGQIDVETIPS